MMGVAYNGTRGINPKGVFILRDSSVNLATVCIVHLRDRSVEKQQAHFCQSFCSAHKPDVSVIP